jgi:hypothetical protein
MRTIVMLIIAAMASCQPVCRVKPITQQDRNEGVPVAVIVLESEF